MSSTTFVGTMTITDVNVTNDLSVARNITLGTWQGSTIAANYGGTGFSLYGVGDVLYADTTTSLGKLMKPNSTSFLQMTPGGAPSWVDSSAVSAGLNPKQSCQFGTLATLSGYTPTPVATIDGAGQALTIAPFTLTVLDTSGFATSGTISVVTTVSSPQSVTYTGLTGTTFTGCVAGGSFTAVDVSTVTSTSENTGQFNAVDFTSGSFDLNAQIIMVGERILVRAQTDEKQNGIYLVNVAGATGRMTRSEDMNGTPSSEIAPGVFTFVNEGLTLAQTGWIVSGATTPIVLNTDNIMWVQFTGTAGVIAGQNIVIMGNEISLAQNITGTTGWQAATIQPTYGGSGTMNTGTLGWGSNNITLTTTGVTTVTLPTTGTLLSTTTTTGVTAASYGSASVIPTYTVDSTGRLTAAANVAITGLASSGLSTTGVTAAGYGTASVIPTYTVDAAGRLTAATNVAITGLASSALTTTGVTAASYGTSTQVPVFTVDVAGRLTTASMVDIDNSPTGLAGGDLTGTYPNPLFAEMTLTASKTQIGFTTTAVNTSIAIGPTAVAQDAESVVIGMLANAAGEGTTILGYVSLSEDSSRFATLIGAREYNDSDGATLLGYNASAITSINATALGRGAYADTGAASTVVGYNAYSTAANGIAIGSTASATASGSIALGSNMVANVANGFFVKHRNDVTPTAARVAVYDNASSEVTGLPYAGGSNYVLTSDASGALAWAAPSAGGLAGGDLTGTYPNPNLAVTGVTAASYGTASVIPTYTVDAKGRLTTATNVAITGLASSALTVTGVTAAGYGTASVIPTYTVDAAGRLTTATNVAITGLASSALTVTGVTAAGYGTASVIPTYTVDAAGRLTAATNVAITGLASSALTTTGVTAASYGTTTQVAVFTVDTAGRLTSASMVDIDNSPTGLAGGDLTGSYPNPDLAVTGVTAASYGTASVIPTYTVDAKGRLTTATNVTISGLASSALTVTGVTAAGYGTASVIPTYTVDAAGRLTAATNVAISGLASSALTVTGVTAAGYGTASVIPTYTVDAAGRLTAATNVAITGLASSALTTTGVTAASYGTSTQVPVFTVDVAGRLTAASMVDIDNSPTGLAGGVLTGSYPNPLFAEMTLTAAKTQIGFATTAVDTSVAIGPTAVAQDSESVVIGSDADADGERCTLVGYLNLSELGSVQTTIVGARCYTNSSAATLLGYNTSANSSGNATVIGRAATAQTSGNSVVIGTGASASTAAGSVCIGQNMVANVANGFFVKHRNDVTPTAARVAVYDDASSEVTGLPYAGGSNYILTSDASGALAWAAPSAGGLAGGDLTGTYPNPNLAVTGVTAASYGTASVIPTYTVDAKGRLTAAVNVTISGLPSSALTATGVTAAEYGTATQVSQFTVDAQGRVTAAANVAITGAAPTGTAGGDLTGSFPNPTLTATGVSSGSYGSSTEAGTFTVDSAGRLTAASSVTITGTVPGGSAGGDLTGTYPNPDIKTIQGEPVSLDSALQNYAIGSGLTAATGAGNTGFGYRVLEADGVGAQNTAFGSYTLRNNVTGSFNTAIGYSASLTNAVGNANTSVGYYALYANTSSNNTAIGYSALSTNTGGGNTALGYGALMASTTESNNTCIGAGTSVSAGVSGATAIGFNMSATTSNGLYMSHRGPGAFTVNLAGFIAGTNELVEVTSSRRFKTNIRDLEEVDNVIDRFRPVRYEAKPGCGDDRTHIGFIAEEVEEFFPEFATYDQDGLITGLVFDRITAVLMKEVQAIRRREAAREAEIQSLRDMIVNDGAIPRSVAPRLPPAIVQRPRQAQSGNARQLKRHTE